MMAEEFDASKVRSISVDSLAVGSKIYLVLEDGTRIWAGGRITESQTTTEEDIWAGKPNIIPEGYYYDASEMDAFHEKLKEHIDWLQSYVDANQLIVNQFAFHDDIYWWKGMNLNEMQEKAERYNKFLREADKETIFNMGSWQSDINTLNKIQKACRQIDDIDVAYKDRELLRLPRRILQILGAEPK